MKHQYLILVIAIMSFSSCVLKAQQSQASKDLFTYEQHIVEQDTLNYRMLLPKNFDASKTYPLILMLHGAGERGRDNKRQLAHGSNLFLNETTRDSFPAIVIFPQCPRNDFWSKIEADRTTKPTTFNYKYKEEPTTAMSLVMDLIDEMTAKPFTNTNQIYVMGLSMGGMGTFEIIYRKPNTFAAAIPICGGGNPESVTAYAKTIPLWIIHGAKDDVVDPKLSLNMASALISAGGFPKLTLYDFANHNSWDPAFAEPDLLKWLFSNSK
ncbi:prolyl oligopeptidase family serine peptidase [Winogradskyella eckloniae]|uniref:carboxylesterase family protein n=1 Tax=Winogradskyella eckloniae TaxID=1089306 RepID=UPI001566C45C|nr:prolyl oligopeptidase family serine peptidase [Winogradskyella eckloniae]NRD18635.1 prolyl oligopeptidase family serine peptidase [Winogradskyella eckloniae]